MSRILITGSRHGWDPDILEGALHRVLAEYETEEDSAPVLVHGNAPGVDTQAAVMWQMWGLRTEPHPASWRQYGRRAGPIRNQQMVDAGAEICVAFLDPHSRGTADCLARAEAAGIPTRVYRRPD